MLCITVMLDKALRMGLRFFFEIKPTEANQCRGDAGPAYMIKKNFFNVKKGYCMCCF